MDWQATTERLKDVRIQKQWTQKTLAERVGINQSTVSDYEAGRIRPSFESLARLLEGLGLEGDVTIAKGDVDFRIIVKGTGETWQ